MTLLRLVVLGLVSFGSFLPPVSALTTPVRAPVVLYTDIASGPNSGGENDRGAYLSVFGKNFGPIGLGTLVKVTIGGVEVDNYRYLGVAKGRADLQQITVQIGALNHPTPGVALPVQVLVDGVGSNTDQTFTVNPGRMLFVDNVHGNDVTAVPGDIAHPYRHVQVADTSKAAYGAMQPGDIMVLRGTGTAWTDLGNDTYFVKFINKSASAPSGTAGTGPFTLMAYPTEDVFIDVVGNTTHKGAISGVDTTSGYLGGLWITIADLHIESGGNAGVIAVQIGGDHWRIVNNELTAATATNNAFAAGINGNGTNSYWVGNHIHNIAGGVLQQNHGIYIDGDGSYEIAYNTIDHVTGGNGMQLYVNGGNGSDFGNNVSFHHNSVHDISKHGINIADGAQNNIKVWNNIVYNTAYASLRFNTNTLHGAKIYNNTFYNAVTSGNGIYGSITNDWGFPSDALDLENNIVVPTAGRNYTGGSVGMDVGIGTLSNNLWNGGAGSVAFDSHPVSGNPQFVNTAADDFHLQSNSAAIDAGSSGAAPLVTDDFDVVEARPVGSAYDIGAYEFDPAAILVAPLFPARILDTRSGAYTKDGLFAGTGPLASMGLVDLTVAGRAGVPVSGVVAAMLNVTVTNPTAAGYVVVWPSGDTQPLASSLNFVRGQTIPNLVLAQPGSNGRVSLRNASPGNVDLVGDVAWYFTASSQLNAVDPARLLDTRPGSTTIDGQFEAGGALAPNGRLDLAVAGRNGLPASGVGAVVINVTATQPSATGFITAWPSDQARPLASSLNFVAGQTIPNLVISAVSANGKVSLFNGSTGSTHLIADLTGWFPQGAALKPLTPARLVDTRARSTTVDSRFAAIGVLTANTTLDIAIAGRGGIPASGAGAVVLNVTAVTPGAAGYLTVWPSATARPLASNLNFVPGQTIPNLVVVALGSDGKVSLFNGSNGSTDIVIDVCGWLPPGP